MFLGIGSPTRSIERRNQPEQHRRQQKEPDARGADQRR